MTSHRSSSTMPIPKKSWATAVMLSGMFGLLGIDRFYLGCVGTGMFKLFTLGGFFLWAFYDYIMLITGGNLCSGYKWETMPWKTASNIAIGIVSILFTVIVPIFFILVVRKQIKKLNKKMKQELENQREIRNNTDTTKPMDE